MSVIGHNEFTERFGAYTEVPDGQEKQAFKEHRDRFWTYLSGDGGDGLSPGWHFVNRMGYYLSERPRVSDADNGIEWVDLTGPVREIICLNPDCDAFEEQSDTYSAIEESDGSYICADCESPTPITPGEIVSGIE